MGVRVTRVAAAAAMLSALAACAGQQPRQHVYRQLAATLTGHQATPGPGDLAGTGTASFRLDPKDGQICWQLAVRGTASATAAQVHRGVAGTVGPSILTLTAPDAGGQSQGCATLAPELVQELAVRPHGFYVNVSNAAFPGGAVRGQLRGIGVIQGNRRPMG